MKPRVLVLDDDLEFTQLLEYNSGRLGCEILVTHNGMQALQMARAELPDVILVDIMLPDLDGLSVCGILYAQPSTRDIPVFILSALDESWARTRRSRARFAEYFTKPVDLKALGRSVLAAAQERHARLLANLAPQQLHPR